MVNVSQYVIPCEKFTRERAVEISQMIKKYAKDIIVVLDTMNVNKIFENKIWGGYAKINIRRVIIDHFETVLGIDSDDIEGTMIALMLSSVSDEEWSKAELRESSFRVALDKLRSHCLVMQEHGKFVISEPELNTIKNVILDVKESYDQGRFDVSSSDSNPINLPRTNFDMHVSYGICGLFSNLSEQKAYGFMSRIPTLYRVLVLDTCSVYWVASSSEVLYSEYNYWSGCSQHERRMKHLECISITIDSLCMSYN